MSRYTFSARVLITVQACTEQQARALAEAAAATAGEVVAVEFEDGLNLPDAETGTLADDAAADDRYRLGSIVRV